MVNFLFWNINKKDLTKQIVDLCLERDIDVLILAESGIDEFRLKVALNSRVSDGMPKYLSPSDLSDLSNKMSFFVRYPEKCFKSMSDEGRLAVRQLKPPIGKEVLIAAMHLDSKNNLDDDEQAFRVPGIMKSVKECEERAGHSRTVFVGDLNMHPFERGLSGLDGFNAVMDRRIVARIKDRGYNNERRVLLYNPMWKLMGGLGDQPAGTYYNSDSRLVQYYWNTFDQVLVSPDLLDAFSDDGLEIIDSTSSESFITNKGIPDSTNYSDHLPIKFSLDIEKIEEGALT